MLRECSFEEISDGRTYELNDMVKADAAGCEGCHKCCTGMGTSIILDPYDIYRLKKEIKLSFQDMINSVKIELNMVDGLILPNLSMASGDKCAFLNESGRCSIHSARPGICRLFPLGRVYQEDTFKYFVQKDQCIKHNLSKVKVKKWIDTNCLDLNQNFICKWHFFIKDTGEIMKKLRDEGKSDHLNDIAMFVLNEFYVKEFEVNDDIDFYEEISDKIDAAKESIRLLL